MPGEHKRSGVWSFFNKVNATESSCQICDQVCRSSGNTTNLRNHLRTKHISSFNALHDMTHDLEEVCAAARLEWGQCHSPEVDETSAEDADSSLNKEKTEVIVKQEVKRKKYKRKKRDEGPTSNAMKNVKIQEVVTVKEEIEHDYDIFGRCIAAQLKKLSEKRAIMLTIEINNLVGEARIEDLDEQLANKTNLSENPHVITVSYGEPICTSNQSDNEGALEINHN